MLIGAHVSSAGGLAAARRRAEEMGAPVAQVFLRSPRAWAERRFAPEDLAAFDEPGAPALFVHASYLVNLASPDDELFERSVAALAGDLVNASRAGARGVVLHPGSHRGSGAGAGVARVAEGLDRVLADPAITTPVLLENTAGAGDTVGRTLEELAAIRGAAERHGLVGYCLDTQHLFASGYDYSTPAAAASLLAAVDRELGLERVRLFHVNESMVAFGANRDRHANLGTGSIGDEALALLVGHPGLASAAGVLEVPGPAKQGPVAADVAAARGLVEAGRARWAEG